MTSAPVSSAFDGKLVGVLFGDEKSMAVISYKDKKIILNLDEEKDGLILEDVGYFHAVISENGEKYRLVLKSDKSGGQTDSPTKMSSSTPTTEKYKISRKVVVEELSDVNSVIKSILIVPYERNGQFEGYRVRRMTNTSVLKKIGVKRNDVIMRLNGKSLETPAVFFDALKKCRKPQCCQLRHIEGREENDFICGDRGMSLFKSVILLCLIVFSSIAFAEVNVNFRDMEMSEFVSFVSEFTGKKLRL